jgi:transglutaminase superfamily protein
VGFLVKREYLKPSALRLEEAAARVGPGATYYTLTMGGGPIGYAASTIDTTPTGITVQNNTVLDIQALGTVQKTGITTAITLTRTLRLVSFDASLISDAARYRASGHVEGDTILQVTIEAGGRPQQQRIRLQRPLVLPELVSLRMAVGTELKAGATYSLRTFDPMTMQEREVSLSVLAESTMVFPDSAIFDSTAARWVPATYDTVRAFKVSQAYGGMTMESWIDGNGNVISATSPIGFTMQRTAFEIAVQNYRRDRAQGRTAAAGAGTDVISTTAIAANARLEPEALRVLRVRLQDVGLSGFDLAGGRQQLSGDTLTVTRESGVGGQAGAAPTLADARLPLVGSGDTAVAAALQPEPLIQSDDPRIAAQARQIAGREHRAAEVARLLTVWVHDNLRKKITISVPSAVQVLDAREGDCNEHTVLYVALARALGLPARTAAGVVYLRGNFYYHAWPEVWLGAWVAVDPTFGQYPADAAHLRFVIGGLARQVELVRLIGRLQVEVVSSQ